MDQDNYKDGRGKLIPVEKITTSKNAQFNFEPKNVFKHMPGCSFRAIKLLAEAPSYGKGLRMNLLIFSDAVDIENSGPQANDPPSITIPIRNNNLSQLGKCLTKVKSALDFVELNGQYNCSENDADFTVRCTFNQPDALLIKETIKLKIFPQKYSSDILEQISDYNPESKDHHVYKATEKKMVLVFLNSNGLGPGSRNFYRGKILYLNFSGR